MHRAAVLVALTFAAGCLSPAGTPDLVESAASPGPSRDFEAFWNGPGDAAFDFAITVERETECEIELEAFYNVAFAAHLVGALAPDYGIEEVGFADVGGERVRVRALDAQPVRLGESTWGTFAILFPTFAPGESRLLVAGAGLEGFEDGDKLVPALSLEFECDEPVRVHLAGFSREVHAFAAGLGDGGIGATAQVRVPFGFGAQPEVSLDETLRVKLTSQRVAARAFAGAMTGQIEIQGPDVAAQESFLAGNPADILDVDGTAGDWSFRVTGAARDFGIAGILAGLDPVDGFEAADVLLASSGALPLSVEPTSSRDSK